MRDFRGLLKLAGIEKKADPPHRGLNDDNPAVRHVYNMYGYLPTENPVVVGGYRDPNVYSAARSAVNYSRHNIPDRKTRVAAMFDYLRRASPAGSYYNGQSVAGNLDTFDGNGVYRDLDPATAYIVLGPGASENALRHELGHHFDFSSRNVPVREDRYKTELNAWRMSGVAPNDPQRVAALRTYSKNSTRRDKLDSIDKLRGFTFTDHSFVDKYRHHNVPIIHDFNSAVANYDTLVDNGRIDEDLSPFGRADGKTSMSSVIMLR